jgi:putative addiction module component (TIGR02574 family)
MTTALDAVISEALKLTPEERTELIERLADTVLPTPPLHPDWEAEIARRVANLEDRKTKGMPAEEVMAELHRIIEAHGSGA